MVQTAKSDIVGPPISTYDPYTFIYKGIRHTKQILYARFHTFSLLKALLEFCHSFSLRSDACFAGLIGIQYFTRQFLSHYIDTLCQ